MITTQKQIQELIDRENKLSPFERLTRYIKKLLIQLFLTIVIVFIGVWVLVAFTDFKLPFLYSETQEKTFTTSAGGEVKTKRKQVVFDFKPRIQKDKIVIKEGKK